MPVKFLSYVPSIDPDQFHDLGTVAPSTYSAPGSGETIMSFDQMARWHWLPKDGVLYLSGAFHFGGTDGGFGTFPAHDLTAATVNFADILPFSRAYAAMSELVAYMEAGGGAGPLFSLRFTGSIPVAGSHKYLTEAANDAVVGNYQFNYDISLGVSGLSPVKVLYANDGLGQVYNVISMIGEISISYDVISGSLTTGLPPGDLAILVGRPANLFAVANTPTSHLYAAGYLGLSNSADPGNPISLAGTFDSTVGTGPDGDQLSTVLGLQGISAIVEITSNLAQDI